MFGPSPFHLPGRRGSAVVVPEKRDRPPRPVVELAIRAGMGTEPRQLRPDADLPSERPAFDVVAESNAVGQGSSERRAVTRDDRSEGTAGEQRHHLSCRRDRIVGTISRLANGTGRI